MAEKMKRLTAALRQQQLKRPRWMPPLLLTKELGQGRLRLI